MGGCDLAIFFIDIFKKIFVSDKLKLGITVDDVKHKTVMPLSLTFTCIQGKNHYIIPDLMKTSALAFSWTLFSKLG